MDVVFRLSYFNFHIILHWTYSIYIVHDFFFSNIDSSFKLHVIIVEYMLSIQKYFLLIINLNIEYKYFSVNGKIS